MSCKSNDDELKLTKEYKYLLSCIRPLIDQLHKSKDAQLCLLWLSKLEQCASWERNYRNKILSELCKQVKANCLKPPFNVSPPSGPLLNIICGDWKTHNWDTNECSEMDTSTEEISSSSQHSINCVKNSSDHHPVASPWKEGYLCNSIKNKIPTKCGKDSVDHSECFAIQKAYHERAQSDQLVIEKYQDIIKSLVSQQLKTDISPSRLKKLQSTYEIKVTELLNSNKRLLGENGMLKRRIEGLIREGNNLKDLKSENERLKQHVFEVESGKAKLEEKIKQVEEDDLGRLKDLLSKFSESEKKLQESEKYCKLLEEKLQEGNLCESEKNDELNKKQNENMAKMSDLERTVEEKKKEVQNLKEQIVIQRNQFEQELSQWKLELTENSTLEKDKRKIKSLKTKVKKLEKLQEHMSGLFQSHLLQIVAKKDFYIASLEMQLKMNCSNHSGYLDINNTLDQKVSHLESLYKKLLEESEQQALKRRHHDLQKIHALEKQILMCGKNIDDVEPNIVQENPDSITTTATITLEDELKAEGIDNAE